MAKRNFLRAKTDQDRINYIIATTNLEFLRRLDPHPDDELFKILPSIDKEKVLEEFRDFQLNAQPEDRVYREMSRSPEAYWYAGLGGTQLSDKDAITWEKAASLISGLAEINRIWKELGIGLPLPIIDDISQPVSKTYIYNMIKRREHKGQPIIGQENISRWFKDYIENGNVWFLQISKHRVVINLTQLQEAFDFLEPEDLRDLRHAVRRR